MWAALRQGARNVAGVRWQVAVSVHLLVAARAGMLPFASMTPEGFEDADCRHVDGSATFAQMKELGAGAGRLAAADVAEVLTHADQAAGDAVVAIITDAELGSGLLFSGWDGFMARQGGQPLVDVVTHLTSRGLTRERAETLVARTRLVTLPWNVRDETERILAAALSVHPAVASYAVGVLYDRLGQTAADQRATTFRTAKTHVVADVDAAIHQVQSTVDVAGLDVAVARGVCAPADYLATSELSPAQFYLGVDGAPGHVTAHLDVLRPREMSQIIDSVRAERYALLLGPSGSGKSVLLWRAARDAVLGARIVRVRSVQTTAQVDLLARHVRLLQPSHTAPVVVAADNLGRPGLGAWPAAVDALREIPAVTLIAACRAEDFHPGLVRGGARIVELQLDEQTAHQVAERVAATGLQLRMAAIEAHRRSGGLLMEFLALLTTGQRLGQILAEQAAGLRTPGRELQRAAARLLLAAHSAGLTLPADGLGNALAPTGPVDAVGDALSVLRGEHIVTVDGAAWRGLHELRSRILTKQLHESPPPTLGDTYATVAGLLSPSDAGWLVRRVAERDSAEVGPIAAALGEIAGSADLTAHAAANLLEGAERADNALYARACLPILQRHLRPGATMHQLALMTYAIRHQGMMPEPMFDAMQQIAAELPDRDSALATAAVSQLTSDRIQRLTVGASLADTVRLLEGTAGLVVITAETASAIYQRHPAPTDAASADLYGRLIEALAAHLDEDQRLLVLGTFAARATIVTSADPTAVDVSVDSDAHVVTATIMHPPHPAPEGPGPDWDSAPRQAGDDANDHAVAVARRLAAACPEAAICEIITLTPSGQRLLIADHEAGYKRMARAVFPPRTSVRRSVGFQAAVRRLTASESWTQLITRQIEIANELAALLADAPGRLSPADNAGRRRRWSQRAEEARARASDLSTQPVVVAHDAARTHARADDADRETDKASEALIAVAQTLPRLLTDTQWIGQAAMLRDAATKLVQAREASDPNLADLGRPIPDTLVIGVQRLARLLTALHCDPTCAGRLRGASASAVLESAAAAQQDRHRAVLAAALTDVNGVELHVVTDPAPLLITVDEHALLVTAPPESWNDLVLALRDLSPDDRSALECHVVAIAVDHGQALPIGIQVTQFGDRLELPMTPEMLRPFTQAADMELRDGGAPANIVATVVDALTSLSWQTALVRRRPSDWPPVPAYEGPQPAELRQQVGKTADPPATGREMMQAALTLLIDHVQAEIDRTIDVTLAGELLDSQGLDEPPDTAAPDVWEALRIASACVVLNDVDLAG